MAVKQVDLPSADLESDPRKHKMVNALKSEIRLLQTFEHKNIVQYLGYESTPESLFIFLEYVPGGSVSSALMSFGSFPESLVKFYISQTLEGLVYLHERDVIHCDIKGGNVLIDNSGMVKISDFGISKKVDEVMFSANNRASLQGSVFWMAPEIVKDSNYTKKCDIWSLGCLSIEMITGKHPYPEYDQFQALLKIGQKKRPMIPENISRNAMDFIDKCLSIDLELRPSAKELLEHPFITSE
ncbi:Protein kinase byr2 [Smittium mucronatum]|uniref:Protein kinase byr2 n=1 Tax=Smittium mucronatum TaxID=133383 RepID=A0A1R0H2U2_9FUNG|nr:Protein kinase byr2 [Smittium mucronatum]